MLGKLVEVDAVLDICPISNVKLDVVEDMSAHPIRQLFDAGIACTISTDDPVSFGNTLTQEYTALHQELGFTFPELAELARTGFRKSLGVNGQFERELAEIDELVEAARGKGD